ncbi:MAG: hypothetical protein HY962_03355 [Ignavibacteriae bacterium]|nr:hypothetical protein [Ignavibacteriota bacterium]
MTVHEMLHQVSLFSSGVYRRAGALSSIEIPLPDGRRQVIYGKVGGIRGARVGMLYTKIGEYTAAIDALALLELNARLRHARVALLPENQLVLIATFELGDTSVRECAPILQEMAAVADELEHRFYDDDVT